MADFLNTAANGPNAPLISSNSAAATLAAMKPLADKANITMLKPARATDQNAFVVTTAFADQHNLNTLSDLAALNLPITLAAPTDCKGRSDCEGGLTGVYGLNIVKIIPLDFDSAQAKDSVTKGESQLGEVGTTDGALASEGLTLLQDDKGIQPAQNLIPATNSGVHQGAPGCRDAAQQAVGNPDDGRLGRDGPQGRRSTEPSRPTSPRSTSPARVCCPDGQRGSAVPDRHRRHLSISPTTKNIEPRMAIMSAITVPGSMVGSTEMLLNEADRSLSRQGVFSPRETRK